MILFVGDNAGILFVQYTLVEDATGRVYAVGSAMGALALTTPLRPVVAGASLRTAAVVIERAPVTIASAVVTLLVNQSGYTVGMDIVGRQANVAGDGEGATVSGHGDGVIVIQIDDDAAGVDSSGKGAG